MTNEINGQSNSENKAHQEHPQTLFDIFSKSQRKLTNSWARGTLIIKSMITEHKLRDPKLQQQRWNRIQRQIVITEQNAKEPSPGRKTVRNMSNITNPQITGLDKYVPDFLANRLPTRTLTTQQNLKDIPEFIKNIIRENRER